MHVLFKAAAVTATVLVVAGSLVGCGGGGDSPAPAPAAAPPTVPTPPPAGSPSAPVITTQPTNASAVLGQSVTFTVAATGTPAPTFQWQRQNAGTTSFSNIPGATSASYTLTSPTVSDNNAQFRVLVTNSAGVAQSLPVALAVTGANLPSPNANIVRMGFFSLNMLTLSTTAVDVTDVNDRFKTSAQTCPAGGSVTATINGSAVTPGATAPASGTLAATFAGCRPETGLLYDGTNSLVYSYTSADLLNGTATGTMTSMRIQGIENGSIVLDETGNGNVSGTLSGGITGNTVTEQVIFNIFPGATQLNGLYTRTATYGNGSQLTVRTVSAIINNTEVPQQVQLTYSGVIFTIDGVTYVTNGQLTQTFANGLPNGGSGQILMTVGGVQFGRIFFNSNMLSIDLGGGQLVPFGNPGPIVKTAALPLAPR